MKGEQLVGTWSLLRFTVQTSRGVLHPFGTAATGRIVYSADGGMSAVLSRGDRSGVGSLETAVHADVDDKARWFDSYLSYAGRWRLDGNLVRHTLELALLPSMVGEELVREATLEHGVLTLRYSQPTRSGDTAHYELHWRRL